MKAEESCPDGFYQEYSGPHEEGIMKSLTGKSVRFHLNDYFYKIVDIVLKWVLKYATVIFLIGVCNFYLCDIQD